MGLTAGGVSLPSGISTREQIIAKQKELGVKADGVWGPKSQAALESSGGKNQFQSTFDNIYSQLTAPKVSYSMPSRENLASQISAYLRPAADTAIASRMEQTLANRAAIDVDASSRGMGRSSFVSDVKDRAMDAEAADIAGIETSYAANLAQMVQEQYNQNLANKFAADQFNASAEASARASAYPYALAEYAKATAGRGGSGGSGLALGDKVLNQAQIDYGIADTSDYKNITKAFLNLDKYKGKYSPAEINAARDKLYSSIKMY